MIAFYILPVYILFHIHVIIWLFRWMKACSGKLSKRPIQITIAVVYFLVALSFVIGFVLPAGTMVERIFKLVGNYMLGITIYEAMAILVADLIRFVLLLLVKHKKRREVLRSRKVFVTAGALVMAVIVAFCTVGVITARNIHTTRFDITVEKEADVDELNVILVADLHIGYNIGCTHIQKMVDLINAEDPDVVVIAGDFFDNEFDAIDDPKELTRILASIQSKYGVYAVWGNHDIDEKILAGFTFHRKDGIKESDLRMDALLEDAGIHLLRDEGVEIAGAYFFGRPDEERPGRGITVRKTGEEIVASAPAGKPILVIDHEPKELHELAAAGVDVDLNGHTHDGQIFPLNLTSRYFTWENSAGYLYVDEKMHDIVTSGVGLFGPNMRVGTKAEICQITIHFGK